jgi:murein L,D-transpeptidase YafK
MIGIGLHVGLSHGTFAATPTVILVDKSKNQLHVAEYINGDYSILKTYSATVGKVKGDKSDEGDLKTPEGIYHFSALLRPPSLKPEFGVMAFYVNYPNPYDQIAGRTGFDIMLHATNEPSRLKLNFDSKGCIVVKNEDLQEIQSKIRLNLTPILIFPDFSGEFRRPASDTKLKAFFERWTKSWETKDIEPYIATYHSLFSAQGKDRDAWKAYKSSLNKRYASIKVTVENPQFYKHPKYSMITFVQNYHSKFKNGRDAHRSRGTKVLYVAEEDGEFKIIAETYTQLMW